MPLYYFRCPNCHQIEKHLMSPEDAKLPHTCLQDGGVLERVPQAVFTVTKEVIDNGLQAKQVEQFSNSAELIEEREQQNREHKYKDEL